MAALTDEILRFGIDRTSPYDGMQRTKSDINHWDVLDQLEQNNALSRDQK
jgi:hypothetical protein